MTFDDNDAAVDHDVVSFSATMSRYGAGYIQDMNFLAREVWPRVQTVAYCHDSYSCRKYASSHPFPLHRHDTEHLGQVFDQFSVGRGSDTAIIRKTPINTDCILSSTILDSRPRHISTTSIRSTNKTVNLSLSRRKGA